jgi:homoserine dehydrogenase
MENRKIKIAVIGLGTVGTGVAKILLEKSQQISHKTGLQLELAHAVDVDISRPRPVAFPPGVLHNDLQRVLDDKTVQIAVELVGGTTLAGEIQKKLLASGKDVVTANKALLAERGEEIYAAARQAGRCIAFEASCCGGIPVIGAIRTGLAANTISAMYGIVNGTCNYILSEMSLKSKEYATALKEAQQAGFAEADPTLDVNGTDSAHKLAILAELAFGQQIRFGDISIRGIDRICLDDIIYAGEMGYTMKLLAIAECRSFGSETGLSLRVHPAFIHNDAPLAKVSGPFNAISIFGDAVGHTSYYGRGAGMMPTASAVAADIIDVAQGNTGRWFAQAPGFGRPAAAAKLCPPEAIMTKFYLRLSAVDQPGVFAQIAKILGNNNISISGCLQHESDKGDYVPVIITTHLAKQGDMQKALKDLEGLDTMKAKPVCIDVVTPPEDQ